MKYLTIVFCFFSIPAFAQTGTMLDTNLQEIVKDCQQHMTKPAPAGSPTTLTYDDEHADCIEIMERWKTIVTKQRNANSAEMAAKRKKLMETLPAKEK